MWIESITTSAVCVSRKDWCVDWGEIVNRQLLLRLDAMWKCSICLMNFGQNEMLTIRFVYIWCAHMAEAFIMTTNDVISQQISMEFFRLDCVYLRYVRIRADLNANKIWSANFRQYDRNKNNRKQVQPRKERFVSFVVDNFVCLLCLFYKQRNLADRMA